MVSAVAIVLCVVLLDIALLHALWGFRIWWPAKTEAELVGLVIGKTAFGGMPPPLACFAVAACLIGALATIAAKATGISRPLGVIADVLFWAVFAVFLLRGLAGFIPPVFAYAGGTPFYRLNMLIYSPLCLAIAAGIAFVGRAAR